MNRCRRTIVALTAAWPLPWPLGALAQPADTVVFTDPTYGYSVRVPKDWKPTPMKGNDSPQRLVLTAPSKAVLFISVHRLAKAVRDRSEFEAIGESDVDPTVAHILKSLGAPEGGVQKKENRSDAESLRYWQGTSALSLVMLSLHAVRYGTDTLVNVVYASRGFSSGDGRAVDAVMASFQFARK